MDPDLKAVPIGEAELLRDGDDIVIVAIGTMVHPSLEAAVELAADGLSVAVVNARFAKPIDTARIGPIAARCGAILTVEEHAAMGGFGASLLRELAECGVAVPARCLGTPDALVEHGAKLSEFGLDAAGIAKAVRDLVGGRDSS